MVHKQCRRLFLGLIICFVAKKRVDCFTGNPDRSRTLPHDQARHFTWILFSNKIIKDDMSNENQQSEPQGGSKTSKGLEKDIAKRFSHPRDQAISALSQPSTSSQIGNDPKDRVMSKLSTPGSYNKRRTNNRKTNNESSMRNGWKNRNNSLLPKAQVGFQNDRDTNGKRNNDRTIVDKNSDDQKKLSVYPPSLLPPPMKGSDYTPKITPNASLSDGLSSWEDFLGAGVVTSTSRSDFQKSSGRPRYHAGSGPHTVRDESRNTAKPKNENDSLPSIADLFPPDFSIGARENHRISMDDDDDMTSDDNLSPPALDGVLPVSDLFYRSSQALNEDNDASRDDEELPFSAEQSDRLATGNRIRVRRNQAKANVPFVAKPIKRNRKSSSPRKMIRRGMEMLVGGVPINADPPQRYVDLMYIHKEAQKVNWYEVVTMNTRDFGPLLHGSSVGSVSKMEQGLFCEHFVHYTSKWDVCPKDLRTLVKSFSAEMNGKIDNNFDDRLFDGSIPKDADNNRKLQMNGESEFSRNQESSYSVRGSGPTENAVTGFGTLTSFSSTSPIDPDDEESELQANLGGELVFAIGVSREELESCDTPSEVPVLERVLARGITGSTDISGFSVVFTKLVLTDLDDGSTLVSGEFRLNLKDNETMTFGEMERKAHRINSSLAQAMDEGDMQLAMAAAAREETAWPEALRNRVLEEFLFDDDDGDGPWENKNIEEVTELIDEDEIEGGDDDIAYNAGSLSYLEGTGSESDDEFNDLFGTPGSVEYHKDDIFLGGGNDGVFWNYAEQNAENSPYGGNLGLRLVDAVVERAKQRQPRVIAIGDVHGCIDELQELLRQCDYRPGDLVVFLGDLVSKGPDSVSVVQMAREIGAIGVRGNHDFEVIRWHQAIKNGVDPPVVGSEHFHIASCLTKADMKWMYSLPWYISSRELGALFVHAGFVSGIRLAKQNPRLMMNMRSILPDGTVTSKFFNNWPWARLWDGPQTVLFGHDADRGLQQYEHAIGLDTGCVYGGRLTACILPEKRLVSVSARREYFKYRRKHYD